MKNRIFVICCFAVLAALIIFFIVLIASIVGQLIGTSSPRSIKTNEIFFAIRLTLITASISATLAMLAAIPVAYILARYTFVLKDAVDAVIYLPIVISPIALGAMLLIFFNTVAGRFFEDSVCRVVFEVPGIIMAQFVVIIGLAISLVRTVFEYIDPVYEDIARTLGASRFYAFRTVLLPLGKRGFVSAFLLTWARAVGEFGATVTFAGATTMKTETLAVAIYLSFASADIYTASVFIVISLVLSMSSLYFIRKIYAHNQQSIV